jgi:hypothetical protein
VATLPAREHAARIVALVLYRTPIFYHISSIQSRIEMFRDAGSIASPDSAPISIQPSFQPWRGTDSSAVGTASRLSVLMMDTFSAVACSDYVETMAVAVSSMATSSQG